MPDEPTQLTLPEGVLDRLAVFHACPVCAVDRVALGHYIASTTPGREPADALPLAVPYSSDDLVRHLMECDVPDRGIGFHDEVEPY